MFREEARQPLTGEARLEAYLDAIVAVLKHARRAASAQACCTGLLLSSERRSIEPMAARLDPVQVLPAIERHGLARYWIVDA